MNTFTPDHVATFHWYSILMFSFSSTANRHALRALARVGAGAYEYFDAKVKSKWEGKVSHADFEYLH